eukprot:1730298-Heterocapsa_arctica.AAC.1
MVTRPGSGLCSAWHWHLEKAARHGDMSWVLASRHGHLRVMRLLREAIGDKERAALHSSSPLTLASNMWQFCCRR